jgi:hypothetical protein
MCATIESETDMTAREPGRPKLTGALKKTLDAMEKYQNKFQTSNVIFETTINCFLASNLLALASPKTRCQLS